MYRCKICKNIDKFELMFAKDYQGEKEYFQCYDENNILKITVKDYSFTPDLDFMNTHAVCKHCGQIYIWEKEGEK